jgi:hypothetical protein
MKGIRHSWWQHYFVLGPMPPVLLDPFFEGPDSANLHGQFDDLAPRLVTAGSNNCDNLMLVPTRNFDYE